MGFLPESSGADQPNTYFNHFFNNYSDEESDDSDAEIIVHSDYEELPLTDNEVENDDGTDCVESIEIIDAAKPNFVTIDSELESEVWNRPRPKELDIELDESKIEEIKNVMANIELPSSSIPEWVQKFPDQNNLLETLQQVHKN